MEFYILWLVLYLNTHAEERSEQSVPVPYEVCMQAKERLEKFVRDNPKMLRAPPEAVTFLCLKTRRRT